MRYYNTIANGYDELHGQEQLRKLAVIKQCIPPDARILDVGCGTGISSMLGNVVGIDPSRKMLAHAGFPVVEGVAEALPFKNNSFDVVISVTALHHCANVQKALHEILRVAKKMAVLSILKKSKNYKEWEKEIMKNSKLVESVDDSVDRIFICGT
jgi:ubiquinone/menaquinone biosynthesis C-methylase UbiE